MTEDENSFKFDVSKADIGTTFGNEEIPTRTELQLAKGMVEDGDLEQEQYEELREAFEKAKETEKDVFGV